MLEGAQNRVDTRNKTSTKLSGAKKENFDAKTKEFEAQKKAYDDKRIILYQIKVIQELQQKEKPIQEDKMQTL
jgi:hypothetical protein